LFEYADYFRVIGTCSDVKKMFLLAGTLELLMRMTLRIRDFPGVDSNCFDISPVFLLAGTLVALKSGIDESGHFPSVVPYT